jgi:hypothetical protein
VLHLNFEDDFFGTIGSSVAGKAGKKCLKAKAKGRAAMKDAAGSGGKPRKTVGLDADTSLALERVRIVSGTRPKLTGLLMKMTHSLKSNNQHFVDLATRMQSQDRRATHHIYGHRHGSCVLNLQHQYSGPETWLRQIIQFH